MAPSTLTAARAASTTAAAQAPMYFHSSAHWGAAHDLAEAARDESLAQVFAQFSENGDTVDRTRIGEVTWRAAAQLRASMHALDVC